MTSLSDQHRVYRLVADFLRDHRHVPQIKHKEWKAFRAHILQLDQDPRLLSAVDLWTAENLDRHHPESVKPRMLHAVEQQFLDKDVHGSLLEAQFQGMISASQLENMLDDLAAREYQPVSAEHVQRLLSELWMRNVHSMRSFRPN